MKSLLSLWINFLLLAAGQGLLLSLGLVSSGWLRNKSNLFLGLITFVISIEVLNVWSIQVGYNSLPNRFPFWDLSSYWTLPPSIYLFGKLNTKASFKLKASHAWLFLPAVPNIVLELLSYYSNIYLGTSIHLYGNPVWFAYAEYLPVVAMILVLVIFGIDLAQMRKNLLPLLPNRPVSRHLTKIQLVYFTLLLLVTIWFLEAIVSLPLFHITIWILCAIIFLLGYLSFFNPDFFQLPPFLTRAISNADPFQQGTTEMERVQSVFQGEKLYLQPKLSLKAAAAELGMPTRTLSELINNFQGTDFRNYVNRLRIEEIIRKVEAGELDQKTLLAIALESGFNSKSAFNQAFKDWKGKSPSQYFSDGKKET